MLNWWCRVGSHERVTRDGRVTWTRDNHVSHTQALTRARGYPSRPVPSQGTDHPDPRKIPPRSGGAVRGVQGGSRHADRAPTTPRPLTAPPLARRENESVAVTFAQLCAILQRCLDAGQTRVTDLKDVALTVLAKQRLTVDVPMMDRALAAVLRQNPEPPSTPSHPHAEAAGYSIDWSIVGRVLAQRGLLPAQEARQATCLCGHGADVHHNPAGRPVSRYCCVVGCGCGAFHARARAGGLTR